MKNWLKETALEGALVRLKPLQREHREDLLNAAADGELWNLWFTSVPSEKTVDSYIDFALNESSAERALPFVVFDKSTNKVIGSTRYCNATPSHRRLELGYTWYSKTYQKTGVNTECKFLLLTHAFETLNCIAVEFRTHWHNIASRNAITRLGAKQDGVLRNHQIDADGILRDSVVFSILQEEWPAVRKSLRFSMERFNR
jgi:RimJ/RimL family protein N-acetyltransferase